MMQMTIKSFINLIYCIGVDKDNAKQDQEAATSSGQASNTDSIKNVNVAPRRSSSRSIKRKKFDDELVESSLKKTAKKVPSSSDVVTPAQSLLKDKKVVHSH